MCVIVTNSTPPTSDCSSGDLLPHGDSDMIGGFRVARRYVAGMESRYGLVFTKSLLSPVTDSPQKTDLLLYIARNIGVKLNLAVGKIICVSPNLFHQHLLLALKLLF